MRRFLIILLLCSSAFGQWQTGVKPMLGIQVDGASLSSKGLVGLWPFNEGSGKIVSDLSGNGNTGIFVSDVSWVSGKFGPALRFAGDKDYIQMGANGLTSLNDFTILIYTYVDVIATDNARIWWKDAQNFFIVRETGYAIEFNNVPTQGSGLPNNIGVWSYHVVLRRGSYVEYWHNGVLIREYSVGTDILDLSSYTVGGRNGSESLDGLISHTMMWNRALSASEIALLYREPFGMFVKDDIAILATAAVPPPAPSGQMITIIITVAPFLIIPAYIFTKKRKAA